MNLYQALEQKNNILTPENKIICGRCEEQYFSPFDKLYITVKGQCYSCEPDEILAENILNNI